MTTKHLTDLSPKEWMESLDGKSIIETQLTQPDSKFNELQDEAARRVALEHEVVTNLGELRRATGLNQTQIADRWGRGQSQVSKVERAPQSVELATLAGYVRALGGQLSITVEVGDLVFHETLLAEDKKVKSPGKKSTRKKNQASKSRSSGLTKKVDASDATWRKQHDDTVTSRSKKK